MHRTLHVLVVAVIVGDVEKAGLPYLGFELRWIMTGELKFDLGSMKPCLIKLFLKFA